MSCFTRWPLIGFMLGNVTGDPTGWRTDRQVVTLCTRLTWVLGLPGIVGVLLQGPVWLAGWSGAVSAKAAVLALGTLRYGLGWPLRIGALALMGWLLGRNHTPVAPSSLEPRQRHRRLSGPQPGCNPGARSCSSAASTSVGATNRSSSPASTGCSGSGR